MKVFVTTSPVEGETVLNCNPKYVLRDVVKYPPLAILSIVRGMGPEHEVHVCDANAYSIDGLVEEILKEKPDVVGISLVTERLFSALEVAKRVKRDAPRTCIVVGGPHTDLYPAETMTHTVFDFMLTGPCELTFPRFIEWYADKQGNNLQSINNLYYRDDSGSVIHTNLGVPTIIDGYPFPDRKRLDIRQYKSLSDRGHVTTMNSSRGCPFRCRFCNVPRYYMTRSAGYVVDEIEEILSLGFDVIHILDDTFNINRARVLEICEMIRKRNLKFRWSTRARLSPLDDELAAAMKEAGCYRLYVGVESHNPEILKYIKKGITREQIVRAFEIIHRYDFETLAYFVIGFPGQTYEDALATTAFIRTIKPTMVLINTLLALPDSDLYYELIASGVYPRDYWRDFVLSPTRDYLLPSWRGADQDQGFLEVMDRIMRDFYLSPRFIMREVVQDVAHLQFRHLARKIGMGIRMLASSGNDARDFRKHSLAAGDDA